MKLLLNYFPELSDTQRGRFRAMSECYREWNARINVISRRDIDSLEERHILHALAIAKTGLLQPGERVLDVGTGGGFPGIPLAVYYPQVEFTLVDSIGKKIRVVEQIAGELGLRNVRAVHARVEELDRGLSRFDWVVSRAVTDLKTLLEWTWGRAERGLMALKGGDLTQEIAAAALSLSLPGAELGRGARISRGAEFDQGALSAELDRGVELAQVVRDGRGVQASRGARSALNEEFAQGGRDVEFARLLPISAWFAEEFFQTKQLVVLQKR